MDPIVFEGVSPRSLGDLLKGYGLIAAVGERCTETLFWWDDGFHLVAEVAGTGDVPTAVRTVRKALDDLPQWAEQVASAFERTHKKSCDKPLPCPDHPEAKKKGKKKTCPVELVSSTDSPLKSSDGHDGFDPAVAEIARAVAVPRSSVRFSNRYFPCATRGTGRHGPYERTPKRLRRGRGACRSAISSHCSGDGGSCPKVSPGCPSLRYVPHHSTMC